MERNPVEYERSLVEFDIPSLVVAYQSVPTTRGVASEIIHIALYQFSL